LKYIYLVLILFLSIGCTNTPHTPKEEKNLYGLFLSLTADTNEAKKLSEEMLLYSTKLKNDYDLVKPPLYHNFLVNIGVRQRGLCWHFAYDMLSHAKDLNLKSFDFYIGGANINDYWEEHNTLVVTCKGCKFEEGIVLDPWRNSGVLYFSYVKNDKNYSWSQRGGLR
jgi:hypothetical protein